MKVKAKKMPKRYSELHQDFSLFIEVKMPYNGEGQKDLLHFPFYYLHTPAEGGHDRIMTIHPRSGKRIIFQREAGGWAWEPHTLNATIGHGPELRAMLNDRAGKHIPLGFQTEAVE